MDSGLAERSVESVLPWVVCVLGLRTTLKLTGDVSLSDDDVDKVLTFFNKGGDNGDGGEGVTSSVQK